MTSEQRATLERILDRFSANVAFYATTRNAEAAERIVSTQADLVSFIDALATPPGTCETCDGDGVVMLGRSESGSCEPIECNKCHGTGKEQP